MNRALWLLLGLQLRGWLRYLGRSLRTVKGALLALVGACVFFPWVLSVLLTRQASGGWPPEALRRYGPAALLAYCLANVTFSTGERAIYFPPAEVIFLFPGPFGRRELLAYKIASALVVSLPTALFMTLMLSMHAPWFLAAFVAILLMILFMQLFSMAINLLAVSVGARLYTRGRKTALAAAVVLAALAAWQAGGPPAEWRPRELFEAVLDTPAWRAASWPLRWFFDAFVATRWPDLAGSAALALLLDLGLVGVVFALDAHYLESAASASARIYARVQRLRRGGAAGDGLGPAGKVRVSLPMLPWWGGVGPTLWRQLTAALRGAGRLLMVLVVLGVVLVAPTTAALQEDRQALLGVLAFLVVWLTLFLTVLVPFDFRGDIDRLALLKTLPLPAWRLAVGQLLAPVLLMSALQWLMLAAFLAVSPDDSQVSAVCLAAGAFAVPVNFLLFALDNLLFLLFPTRLMAQSPGDFQTLGRNVLFMTAKAMALAVVALAAGLVGLVGYKLTGDNELAGVAAAWPVVAGCGAALVPLVAWAFTAFDVSRDTPA
jgi:Putative ABC exporter